jgi:hypothetical protein
MNPHKPRGDGIAVSGIVWALRKSRAAATLQPSAVAVIPQLLWTKRPPANSPTRTFFRQPIIVSSRLASPSEQ